MNKVETKIKLVLNNENYDFEIGFDKDKTEIVFSIDEEDKFLSEYYTTKIKLESFLKLSKYFIVCDSIDDIMDCFKNINSELKNENKKYNLDFYIKNDEAILKYNVPIQTGKNISFELLFKKEEKNKDLIIAKLKERVRDLEEGYFAVEKIYDNEIQNEICQTFKKIRNYLNKKELELYKKFEELRKKSKIENIRLYNKNVFINEITDIMNDISLSDRFYFQWKNGPNYSLDENNTIATKISGGECSNCTILGDRILP